MDVNGTLIWYYNICKREVWMMSRNIVPDQSEDNIDYGKFMHENTYKRNKKEILFGNVKFDVLLESKDKLVIGETKKTSHYESASRYQLLYYLKQLKEAGIEAEGVLLYPEEKKRVPVLLDDKSEIELDRMAEDIVNIAGNEVPPAVKKCKYCGKCGYREYCFA